MLTTEVARRLEQKLGLGQFPLVRRRMYARLQRLAVSGGEGVLRVIADLLQEADGPKIRDKGNYFCWVIKRRLGEAGYDYDAGSHSAVQDPSKPPSSSPAAVKAQFVANLDEKAKEVYPATREQVQDDLRRQLEKRRHDEVVQRLREKAANNPEAL
jgi:hypothetical protein